MAASETPVADAKARAKQAEQRKQGEPVSPAEGLEALKGDPDDATMHEIDAATRWFLDPEPDESASGYIPLNVAGPGQRPKWIKFKIQILGRDRIKEIRQEATVTKGDGSEEVDELEANLRTCVEALLEPDLSRPENRVVRGQHFLDPADALQARFAHKPGLIDQLSTQIANASGYNRADVKELEAGKT